MSVDIVKFAFIAGEISPTLYGRTDLTKFDLGMAEAKNFFVDYRGGLSSRPGFRFMEHVAEDDKHTRMTAFAFAPDQEDTYTVLFGHEYIRFLQAGSYVLEDDIAISGVTQSATGVLTATAHGLTAGRCVKISGVAGMTQLNGKTFEVRSPAANTFQLYSIPDGTAVNTTAFTAYTSGGVIKPVYELSSPYDEDDLDGLAFDQYRDRLRITSLDFPPYDLTRSDHTDWDLAQAEISPYHDGPSITSSSTSAAGSAQTIFSVTKVLANGTESVLGNMSRLENIVNYPVTEGSVSILWTAEPDAVYYNVYRSIVSVGEDLSFGSELGYVGRTRGTKFTDPNIIPDFSRVPPSNYNPFKPGSIQSITVTAPGTGYTTGDTVAAVGAGATGTDFVGQVIVDDAGTIVNVIVKNGGSGYADPVAVSFTGGTGGTATAVVKPLTGTYPALSAIFQQRQVHAASRSEPITIWGSQYKRFENFSYSELVLDSDSYEMTLDTAGIAPVRHLLATRGGLLAMTQETIWLLNGGGVDKPLTPTNALADPQTYTGVSTLLPLRIGSGILYTEGKGYAVRMLEYSEASRVYGSVDRSLLANHLFGPDKEIIRWGFQESPFKTVWAVRADGILLAFTIVSEEEVFAWTPCETRGLFTDLLVQREGNQDVVYVTVKRFINGRWSKFIERMDLRQFVNVEDAWCVDCGLELGSSSQSGTVTIYRDEDDNYTAVRSSGSFTGSAGKVLRVKHGIFRVDTVTSATEVALTMWAEPLNWVPQTDRAYTSPESEWTLDAPVTQLSGLDHLEGEEVAVLGDGNVFPRQVVENGAITLPNAVTRAIVGLPFTCQGKTLPLIVPDAGIEAKRKRVVAVSPRLINSRGLKMGDAYDRLYAMKERTIEAWGRPTALQDGIHHQSIGTTWDEEAFTYFKLEDPLPVTLLSLVQDMEVGDDSD